MEPEEYALIAAVEDSHWWYHGLRKYVIAELESLIGETANILDAGCGAGGIVAAINARFPRARIVGVDISPIAIPYSRAKVDGALAFADVNALPFPDATFDAIISLDVICNAAVDEKQVLREFMRAIKPGGVILLQIPAYEWLRSDHDVVVHTARRYTARNLRASAGGAGFEILMCGYRNSLLFPLMIIQRLVRKVLRPTAPKSAVIRHGSVINTLLSVMLDVENMLHRRGIRFPIGGSVFAVLRKPSS